MLKQGWLKLHRRMLEWEWYDDHSTCRVFFHLLLTVNHEKKIWHGVEILPGSKVTSLKTLAKEVGLGVQEVRTSLTRLKSTRELTIKTTSKYSLIQLNNWETYQSANTPANKQLTRIQHASNTHLTTMEEGKKVRRQELSRKDSAEHDDPEPNSLKTTEPTEPMNEAIDRSFPRKRLYGDEAYNWLLDFFEYKFSRDLIDQEKWSRIYLKHLKGKIGFGKVKDILEWASDPDCWWYSRLTGFKMLYYKRETILRSMEASVQEQKKAIKPYIDGERAYKNEKGDWMIIPNRGGQHLHYVGSLDAIKFE